MTGRVFNEAQFYHTLCFPLLFWVSVRPEGGRSMTAVTGRKLFGGGTAVVHDIRFLPATQKMKNMTTEFSNREN